MIIEIETKDPLIEVQETSQQIDVVQDHKSIDVIKEETIVEVTFDEIQVVEVQEVGAEGPPGEPGPPGGFEIVPLALTGGVWTNVPLAIITYVVDVVVYNQINREKVELDVRINPDQTVEVKSSSSKTFNIHVSGV